MRRVDDAPFNFVYMSTVVPEGTFNILRYGGRGDKYIFTVAHHLGCDMTGPVGQSVE